MILFLLLSSLEKYGIDIDIQTWFFPILITGLLLLVLIGYLEDKLGFHEAEQHTVTKRNPQLNEILNKLKILEKEIKRLKK